MKFENPSSGPSEQKKTPLLRVLAPAVLTFFAGFQANNLVNAEKFTITEAGHTFDKSEELTRHISGKMVGLYRLKSDDGNLINDGLYETSFGPVYLVTGENNSIAILRLNADGDGRVLDTNIYNFKTDQPDPQHPGEAMSFATGENLIDSKDLPNNLIQEGEAKIESGVTFTWNSADAKWEAVAAQSGGQSGNLDITIDQEIERDKLLLQEILQKEILKHQVHN